MMQETIVRIKPRDDDGQVQNHSLNMDIVLKFSFISQILTQWKRCYLVFCFWFECKLARLKYQPGRQVVSCVLGQGYYHSVTCDQPNTQPIITKNFSYLENFDGFLDLLYSQSVEKQMIVVFPDLWMADFIQVTYEVLNQSQNQSDSLLEVKIKIDILGLMVYPNKSISVLHLAYFLNSENDDIGKMQLNTQPKDFLPECITYKLISNYIKNNPDSKEVFTIINMHTVVQMGSTKIPLQMVQYFQSLNLITIQPTTNGLFGKQNQVGKKCRYHSFATYTFAHLGGDGIQILIWFFVNFGSSYTQKKVQAQNQWKQTKINKNMKTQNTAITSVLLLYRKIQYFPGFNGCISLWELYHRFVKLSTYIKFSLDTLNWQLLKFICGMSFNYFEEFNFINQCIPNCII